MRGYLRITNNDPPNDSQLEPETIPHIWVDIPKYGSLFVNCVFNLLYMSNDQCYQIYSSFITYVFLYELCASFCLWSLMLTFMYLHLYFLFVER